jgi:hypothetical protein
MALLIACQPTQADQPAEPTSDTASPSPPEEASEQVGEPTSQITIITPPSSPTTTEVLSEPRPTPSVDDWNMTDDVLLSPSLVSDCELPCWQGLVIGTSGPNDVQAMFDNVFGLMGSRNFIEEIAEGKYIVTEEDYPPLAGLILVTEKWFLPPDFSEAFEVRLWLDQGILIGMEFESASKAFDRFPTPQKILRTLGEPSHMLISLDMGNRTDLVFLRILTIYDQGIILENFITIPVSLTVVDGVITGAHAEVCLGGETWYQYDKPIVQSAYITEPLTNRLEDLSPLQQVFLIDQFDTAPDVPVEEFFDITLEELISLALQDEDPCVLKDLSQEYGID